MDTYDGRPLVVPSGWSEKKVGGLIMLFAETAAGLRATFTLERYAGGSYDQTGPMGAGTYARVVISRADRYPDWDEMRDFIQNCGLFDRKRDIFMIIPPETEYVNIHKNCFHWWQQQG